MIDQMRHFDIHRILVAVNTSTENRETLEAAADMAALLQAELHGLFIEDPQLFQLEELSSSRKIDLPQGFTSTIERGSMERELKALANRTREIIAHASEQRRVEWSFQIVRGSVQTELTSAAGPGDLVVAESSGRTIRTGLRMRSTTTRACKQVERPVLFLQRGPRPAGSIVAVYDASAEADAVLDAALRLYGGPGALLTILLPADDREGADQLRHRASQRLDELGIEPHFRRVSLDSAKWIVKAVEDVHGDILIQSAHSPPLNNGDAETLLDELSCPILLLR
jgi:nucleotide-binding universal stress UspA family protein